MTRTAPEFADRSALRRDLLAARRAFAATPAFGLAQDALQAPLREVLAQLGIHVDEAAPGVLA